MALYTYGIIDSSDQVKDSIYGLEGARVYNIPFCDIGAVVSEINQPIQGVTEGAVLKHEAVTEKLMANFAVLPVRFQTVIDNRDNLLSMMQNYYVDFKDNLERLHNKIEFGIKVIWPSDKVKQNIVEMLKRDQQKTSESCTSAGKRFIREKFERYRIDRELATKADKFIRIMDMFFSKFAVEKNLEKLKSENLLLDAVYLVEKDNQDNFKEAFEHIKSAHTAFKFLFSGPWPPYNFVILPKKSDLLKDSEQEDLFDKVIRHREPVGADKV